MNLIKTSLLTSLSTIVRIVTGFIINKVIAVYIGASGLAVIGQLQNFTMIVSNITGGSISQGVVKYGAQYKDNEDKRANIFTSALFITLCLSVIGGVFTFSLSNIISVFILKTDTYGYLFKVFGVLLVLFSLNVLLLAVLNSLKAIREFVISGILSSILSLFITSILIVNYKIDGALLALVINQSFLFFITLVILVRYIKLKSIKFVGKVDKRSVKKLGLYSLMTLLSVIATPMSHIYLRDYIVDNLGWESAGWWQGMWYISTTFLMVITTSLSVYYLPRLSEITKKQELKKEVISVFKIVMPIVVFLALGVYIFRDLAITILFSKSFLPMEQLFLWQLIGDIIKMASWILGYIMLAKAMVKVFLITEISFTIIFIILAKSAISQFGIIGMSYAYATSYFLYLLIMIVIFIRYINSSSSING